MLGGYMGSTQKESRLKAENSTLQSEKQALQAQKDDTEVKLRVAGQHVDMSSLDLQSKVIGWNNAYENLKEEALGVVNQLRIEVEDLNGKIATPAACGQ